MQERGEKRRRAQRIWQHEKLAVLALGLILLAGLLQLPRQAGALSEQRSLLRHWQEPDVQYRLLLTGVPYDTLRAVDKLLPRTARLLLVTPGADVRHIEYITYHRALYFLSPRPVWWLSPAPPDGTWESRWWLSAPATAGSIRQVAAAKNISCVLLLDTSVPGLDGRRLAAWPVGELWQVSGADGTCRDEMTAEAALGYPAPFWLLRLAAALLAVLALGSGVLTLARHLGYAASGLTGLALAWIAGSGLLTVAMLWLDALGAGLQTQMRVLMPLALLAAGFSWWTGRRAVPAKAQPVAPRLSLASAWTWLLLALLVVQIGFVLLQATGRPLTVWDSWVNWSMKARIIFREGGITPSVYADPSRAVTLLDYPLSLPLLQAWLYGWLGAPDDRLAGLPFLVFFLALLAILYNVVRARGGTPRLALLATAALAATPAVNGLAASAVPDFVVAVLALLAAASLLAWQEGAPAGQLFVGALAAGLLPWTKREGLVLLASLCMALLVAGAWRTRRGWTAVLAAALAAAVLAGPWWWFSAGNAAVVDVFLPLSPANLWRNMARFPTITGRMLLSVLAPASSYVWPLALLLGLARWRARPIRRPTLLFLPLAALLYFGLMSIPYLVSNYAPYQQHVVSSAPRLAAQVTPLLVLWFALEAGEVNA